MTWYLGSCGVGQVGRCISKCVASCANRSATLWYLRITTVILLWISRTTIEEGLLYVLVLWIMAQEADNYTAQTILCFSYSPECCKNILLNSVLFKLCFSLLLFLHEDLPLVSLQIIWLKFSFHFSSPHVCHMPCASHLTFDFVILIILADNIFYFLNNPDIASVLDSEGTLNLRCSPNDGLCVKAQTCSHG